MLQREDFKTRLEKEQPLCMECADLGHLEYLPRGDMAHSHEQITFVLGSRRVIAGLEAGVQGMSAGGTRESAYLRIWLTVTRERPRFHRKPRCDLW